MLEKIIKNRSKIIEGIKTQIRMTLGNLPEEEEKIIIDRRLICHDCPFNSKNAEEAGWYASNRPDEHCTMCLCNTDIKTACLSCKCGITEYNDKQKNEQDKLEVKW